MFNFFENPWGLIAVSAFAFFVLLIFRAVFPEKRLRWMMLIPALLILAAFGLDYLIETDAEKIDAAITAAVKAAENEDPDSIEMLIADNYRDSYHRSKNAFMSHCRRTLSEPLIEKNIMRIVSMDIQPAQGRGLAESGPPQADVIFTVRVLFDKQSRPYQGFKQQMLTELQANLQKQPDGRWLISRAELLKIDLHPASWQDVREANW